MLEQLLPIVILAIFVAIFGGALVYLTTLSGHKPKKVWPEKLIPYECGIPGQTAKSTKIPVKFYLTAISFILFDIEVVFLYPWILIYKDNLHEMGGYLLGTMGVFLAVLVFGLIYELRSKALEWE